MQSTGAQRTSRLLTLAIAVIAIGYMATNMIHRRWIRDGPGERGVIHWDVISYYSYLPATFIYGDLSLEFLDDPPEGFVNDDKFWPSTLENGNKLIITSMGLSVLYTPFFLAAHVLAPLFGEPREGYSSIYQFFLVISALFYVVMGFVLLKRLLARYFSSRVIFVVLLALAFGTNLLYYSTYEGAMAHSYNFFLLILFMHAVMAWYRRPGWLTGIGAGALLGFIALVRPTNILAVFLLLLWEVRSGRELAGRIMFFLRKIHLVGLMVLAFLAVWTPQFLYWKSVTGQYLFFSYAAEGASFYWAQPHIWQSLFGFKKGWFIYTPMMLLAVAGIPLLRRRIPGLFVPVLVLLVAMIYVQSSWWSWWFGGGFGLRAYIDIYGVMALPLAALVERLVEKPLISRPAVDPQRERAGEDPLTRQRVAALSVIGLLVAFQLFNTYQYTRNIIHYVGMNRNTYLKSLLRTGYHPDHWTSLTMPDYQLARKGIYVFYLTGDQYDYLGEMNRKEALEEVHGMILEVRRLERQIERHARRNDMDPSQAREEVAERMYLEMTQ